MCAVLPLVTQSRPTFCHPMDCIACQAPLFMGFPRQEYWSEYKDLSYISQSLNVKYNARDLRRSLSPLTLPIRVVSVATLIFL